MAPDYEFTQRGRRPLTIGAAAFALVLLWIAAANDAPWWIWTIWLPPAAGIGWLIVANPVSRLTLRGDDLAIDTPGFRARWRLSGIERARFTKYTDGPDACVLHLADGATVRLPETAMPPGDRLAEELSARGVEVERG